MKHAEQTDNDGNSSFISDVLDFVSRELNHFVANATGVAVAVEPLASSRGQNQPRRPSKLQNRRLNSTDSLTQSLSLDGLQPHYFATQAALEPKIAAPMPHSIMPGTFLPRSPTLEPNNLPDLHITTSMKPLLHDKYADGKDEEKTVASHQTYQNSVLHDDNLPSAAMALCGIPTSSKSTEDDKNITSSGGSPRLEQTRSHDCIDILSLRPAAGESPERNDASAEHVGFLQEQKSSQQKMREERLRDKEKIQYLEEEIRKLKEELLKKDVDKSIFLPPPAPPPPPARTVSTRIPAPSKISDPSLLITSARASLKRAPTPVEAPINPRMPTKRQGLPAVGVPPDKMAAFLSELKNVRLRKVGSNSKHTLAAPNLSTDSSISSYSNLSFDGTSATFDKSSTKPFTFDFVDPNLVETGAKRKRELYDDGANLVLSDKMHSMVSAVRTRRTAPSPKMDVTTLHPWDNAGPNSRIWPSNFANENTTPSLTSDNDRERDDVSPDERTPETPPPDILHHIREPKEVPEANAYIQCRDMPSANGSPSSQAVPYQAFGMEDIFSRRVPTSPLPPKTHRKPYPPSKARRSPRNTSVISMNSPQSVTSARDSAGQPPQEQIVEPPPRRDLREIAASRPFAHYSKKGRSRSQRKQQNYCPRGTLDQELRRAVKSLESIATENPPDYEECDVFIGVGFHEKSTNCRPCDGSTHNAENKLSQVNLVPSHRNKHPKASNAALDGS